MGLAGPSSSSPRRCGSPRAAALARSSAAAPRPGRLRPARRRSRHSAAPRCPGLAAIPWESNALPMGTPGPAPGGGPGPEVPARGCHRGRLHLPGCGGGSRLPFCSPSWRRPAHLGIFAGLTLMGRSDCTALRRQRGPGSQAGRGTGFLSSFMFVYYFILLRAAASTPVPDRREGSRDRGRGGAKVTKNFNESRT